MELHGMKNPAFHHFTQQIVVRVHHHRNTRDMSWKFRRTCAGFLERKETPGARPEVETKRIGSRLHGGFSIARAGDAADFDARGAIG